MSKSKPEKKSTNGAQEQGVIKIPQTPPKATTAAQTDELLKVPGNNMKLRLEKYLTILNESGGALVPHIIAEIGRQKDKHPEQVYLENFWHVLDAILDRKPEALAILEKAREDLKKAQILESPESRLSKPLPQVKTYGLLNDSINHNILVNGFAPVDSLDGQLCMLFETNQAGKNEKPFKVVTALTYEGQEPLISRKMTGYDRSVYNAVSTLYHYSQMKYEGEPCIVTPQEIWRTMNGISDQSKTPTPAQVKKVCSSIDKMRFTRIYLDISEELQRRKITFQDQRITSGKIDTYYLKAERGTFLTEKGRIIDAYKIENEPILYTYNRAKNRVLFIPFNLLNTADAITEGKAGNEGHTIEIREYLLYEIMLMYNKERNKRILFKTLYEKTGIDTPENRINRSNYTSENAYKTGIKKEAAKDRDKVKEILTAWKNKGFIKGFEFVGNRPIVGVDIKLSSNPPKFDAD